jgi:hypothetical protein
MDSLAVPSLRRRDSGRATNGSVHGADVAADRAWLAFKPIVALLAASKDPALLLELSHGNRRKGGGQVVLRCLMVNLMDLDDLVDDVRLDDICQSKSVEPLSAFWDGC